MPVQFGTHYWVLDVMRSKHNQAVNSGFDVQLLKYGF